jgi:PKD repeat protein
MVMRVAEPLLAAFLIFILAFGPFIGLGHCVSYDLNGDGIVNCRDLLVVIAALGSMPGNPLWNPVADVNMDNGVDMKDYVLVAQHVGNCGPTASFEFSPSNPVKDEQAYFDASSSQDCHGAIISYSWSFGDGASGEGRTASHIYAVAGIYSVTLTVKADSWLTDSVTKAVNVSEALPPPPPPPPPPNQPPVAVLSCSPVTVYAYDEVTMDSSASYDPDGSVTSYWFDSGDGSSSGWVASPTFKHAYTSAGIYFARAMVKDDDGLMSSWSSVVSIDVREPGGFEISAVWKNEIDNMIVPYDTVEMEFSFKSNFDSTLHDVVISYWSTTDVISGFDIPMQSVGTIGPYQQFPLFNNITVAGVDNIEIYNTIIVDNDKVDLAKSLGIRITYEVDGIAKTWFGKVTPTDKDNVALFIQYPDYQKYPDFSNPSPMREYYLQGDANFHNPDKELVRKYAVVASAYPEGIFPDVPAQTTGNIYSFIDGLFASAGEAKLDNDLEITWKIENGSLVPGRELRRYICISQAYFFGSLARTIGLPSRELTIALGFKIINWWPLIINYTQEAAIQVWYEYSWHLYDTFDGHEDVKYLDDYKKYYLSYVAWAAFNRRDSSMERPDLDQPQLYGHDFGIINPADYPQLVRDPFPASPDQWEFIGRGMGDWLTFSLGSPATMLLVDHEGRRTGTTFEGAIINEIPGAIYFPPGSYGYSEAGNPDSIFEIKEMILIPGPAVGSYELTVTGTDVGNYTITVALISEETVIESAEFTGEISPGERMLFTILASENELTAISWEHIFTDVKRNTTLRISTDDRYFQFIAPDKDFGVKHDANMKVLKRVAIISYDDTELRLIATAIDDGIDFCSAVCWDKQTRKTYLLIDKPDWRGYLK